MTDFYGDTRATTPRAAGWLSFAAAVLVVSGLFKILDALWAFKYDYGGRRDPGIPASD